MEVRRAQRRVQLVYRINVLWAREGAKERDGEWKRAKQLKRAGEEQNQDHQPELHCASNWFADRI
jgi:hypothetical protein